jgi:penicillin-insensitive murein endopeptidase
MRNALLPAVAALFLVAALPASAADGTPAKILFSKVQGPAPLAPRSIGSYARGCVAGAEALPITGPDWQVMRLSRNRNWGMPQLVDFIETLAADARRKDGWPGLLIGDLGQPRGGPAPTGHLSHQTGLDVDIWLDPMPDHVLSTEEREKTAASKLLKPGSNVDIDMRKWPAGYEDLLKRAASYDQVERIFVNPGIKKVLCERAGTDRAWLHKIRPWYQHDDHFHVRLKCPAGMASCKSQDAVPAGDGCGDNLAYWLGPAPWRPAPKPKKPAPPPRQIMLSDLPPACAAVLTAGTGATAESLAAPIPRSRPSN